MPDEESFCHKYGQIRSSIIPTESVRMLKLNLGPNENGLVVNYETTPEEISHPEPFSCSPVKRESVAEIDDCLPDLIRSVLKIMRGAGDQAGNEPALFFLHASGGYRRRTDPDTAGNERFLGIIRNVLKKRKGGSIFRIYQTGFIPRNIVMIFM